MQRHSSTLSLERGVKETSLCLQVFFVIFPEASDWLTLETNCCASWIFRLITARQFFHADCAYSKLFHWSVVPVVTEDRMGCLSSWPMAEGKWLHRFLLFLSTLYINIPFFSHSRTMSWLPWRYSIPAAKWRYLGQAIILIVGGTGGLFHHSKPLIHYCYCHPLCLRPWIILGIFISNEWVKISSQARDSNHFINHFLLPIPLPLGMEYRGPDNASLVHTLCLLDRCTCLDN